MAVRAHRLHERRRGRDGFEEGLVRGGRRRGNLLRPGAVDTVAGRAKLEQAGEPRQLHRKVAALEDLAPLRRNGARILQVLVE